MSAQVILSQRQAVPLLKAHQEERRISTTSLDLGIPEVGAIIEPGYFVLAPGVALSLEMVEEIAQDQDACFLVEDGKARKIQLFSERTNLFYSLLPTSSAPTLTFSGIPMHRIKDPSPWLDSQWKV